MTLKTLILTPTPALTPEISQALSMLQLARERTIRTVKTLSPGALDGFRDGHSIGTLLYHIAIVELDWLYTEVREEPYPEWALQAFPTDHRTADGKLATVQGETLEQHLERLDRVRKDVLDTFQSMDGQDYLRLRVLSAYQVSPQWVLFHLLHHETLHFGQIQTLIRVMDSRNSNFGYL